MRSELNRLLIACDKLCVINTDDARLICRDGSVQERVLMARVYRRCALRSLRNRRWHRQRICNDSGHEFSAKTLERRAREYLFLAWVLRVWDRVT